MDFCFPVRRTLLGFCHVSAETETCETVFFTLLMTWAESESVSVSPGACHSNVRPAYTIVTGMLRVSTGWARKNSASALLLAFFITVGVFFS